MMKNKSRRVSSTGKKQKNKTRKNKKGGMPQWQIKQRETWWKNFLYNIVYAYYDKTKKMPTKIGKEEIEISEIQKFINETLDDYDIKYLNYLYLRKVGEQGLNYYCKNFTKLIGNDKIKRITCKLGLKDDEFNQYISHLKNVGYIPENISNLLGINDHRTICESMNLNKFNYANCLTNKNFNMDKPKVTNTFLNDVRDRIKEYEFYRNLHH